MKRSNMPGPPRKQTKLKLLTGNPGKKKLPQGIEPTATRGLPECPPRFVGAARDAWVFLAGQAVAMEIDYRVDALALEGACVAYGRAYDADAVIDALGATFTSPNGYVQQRPEVSIALQSWKLFKSFSAEWGFTPAARTRLNIEPAKDKSANMFAALGRDADDKWNSL
jgi:P27 family predicted phage terminase small subunit